MIGPSLQQIARAHSYAAGRWRTMVPRFDVDFEHDRGAHRQRLEARPFLALSLEEQSVVVARIAWREHSAQKQVN